MKSSYILFFILLFTSCVNNNDNLIVDFEYPTSDIYALDTIPFLNKSKGYTFYKWYFGDVTSSETESPKHCFQNYGTFTVKLKAGSYQNLSLNDSIVKTITVKKPKPISNFSFSTSASNEQYVIDQPIDFHNASMFSNNNIWDFGDGSYSNEVSPSHVYSKKGTYNVSLRSINELGESTFTQKVSISDFIVLNIEIKLWSSYSFDLNSDGINDITISSAGSFGHTISSSGIYISGDNLSLCKHKKYIGDTLTSSMNDVTDPSMRYTLSEDCTTYYPNTPGHYIFDYWISNDIEYLGYLLKENNVTKIGWLKIKVTGYNTMELLGYRIAEECDSMIIE